MGTEEQVETAKGLIENFVSQMSGLSCLKHSNFAILILLDSMHSNIVILTDTSKTVEIFVEMNNFHILRSIFFRKN